MPRKWQACMACGAAAFGVGEAMILTAHSGASMLVAFIVGITGIIVMFTTAVCPLLR